MAGFSDLTVIIPTLNEREDVPKLINILRDSYKGVHIIISDDGSTDGTKEAVEVIARKSKGVLFLDRRKKDIHGLTASVVDAAMLVKTRKIVVMDGDMQHPPNKVGSIARALDRNDVVIGVRSTIKNWDLHRRIVSKSVNALAYSTFKMRGRHTTKDMMSGFFGIRSRLFRELISENSGEFTGKGYKVLLDILRLADRSVRVAEIRYDTFQDRRHGRSKLKMMGIHQMPKVLRSVLR